MLGNTWYINYHFERQHILNLETHGARRVLDMGLCGPAGVGMCDPVPEEAAQQGSLGSQFCAASSAPGCSYHSTTAHPPLPITWGKTIPTLLHTGPLRTSREIRDKQTSKMIHTFLENFYPNYWFFSFFLHSEKDKESFTFDKLFHSHFPHDFVFLKFWFTKYPFKNS